MHDFHEDQITECLWKHATHSPLIRQQDWDLPFQERRKGTNHSEARKVKINNITNLFSKAFVLSMFIWNASSLSDCSEPPSLWQHSQHPRRKCLTSLSSINTHLHQSLLATFLAECLIPFQPEDTALGYLFPTAVYRGNFSMWCKTFANVLTPLPLKNLWIFFLMSTL